MTPTSPWHLEQLLLQEQAEQVVVLDLRDRMTIVDFMVIASGHSSRHLAVLAEKLYRQLKPNSHHLHIEGLPQGDWVLIDAGDVIVHLFRPEVREFYQLEKLWSEPSPDLASLSKEPSPFPSA